MTKAAFSMLKKYFQLLKPGYIFSNCLTAAAGFFLASREPINWYLLFTTLIAISLGMASACVFNNYIDRGIDSKMERTKKRALVTGTISTTSALTLATILGVISVFIFIIFTNILTLLVGAIGLFFYLVLYSVSKRKSTWSTLIGTVPGAVVPVAGYTAVTNRIDLGAILIFLLLVFWQMPHFYAISIYRIKEYKVAQIPLLSVVKGVFVTKIHILFYVLVFSVVSLLLSILGYTGKVYFFSMLFLSLIWIIYAIVGFFVKNTDLWARRMFFFSLIINLAVCLLIFTNFLFV